MSKIIVTGGAGFIGSHLVDGYIKSGHEVVIIDNLSTGNEENINPEAKFYHCDISNFQKLQKIILNEKPEIINHHAGQTKVDYSITHPLEDVKSNLVGTINILESIKGVAKFQKFIFASSGGAIYGETSLPCLENSTQMLNSPYGINKLSSEKYIQYYANRYNFDYIIFRYANVYGTRQKNDSEGGVVSIFINKLIKNETLTVFGNGNQTRDFIFIEDALSANIKALEATSSYLLNISTTKETSINNLIGIIEKQLKKKSTIIYNSKRMNEKQRSCLNSMKAKRVLDWQPKISLSSGVKKLILSSQDCACRVI